MDKQNVVYAYNGILCGNKNKLSTDTHYDIHELWKYYAKKKVVTKYHLLYGSIYTKGPENPSL